MSGLGASSKPTAETLKATIGGRKIGNSLVINSMKGGYGCVAATNSRVNSACGIIKVPTE